MINFADIKIINTVPNNYMGPPGRMNEYPFIWKTGSCFFHNNLGETEEVELVGFEAGSFCSRSATSTKRCVMSSGFTGCMFIVEKTFNNELIGYHLTLEGGERSLQNKRAMANYIYTKNTNEYSIFWGIKPTFIINPFGEQDKKWQGKRVDGLFNTVIAVSDNVGNMAVLKAHHAFSPNMHNNFFVDETIVLQRPNILKNAELLRYLE